LAFNFQIQHQSGLLNGRVDALSQCVDHMHTHNISHGPLLRFAALESCQPVWIDNCILHRIKEAITEDATLEPLLAFFKNNKIPSNIHRRCDTNF